MVNNESNSSLKEPSFEESAFFKQAMHQNKDAEDQAFIEQYIRPETSNDNENIILNKYLDTVNESKEHSNEVNKDSGSMGSNLDELMFDLPERYDSQLMNTSFYFSTNERAKDRLENNAKMFNQEKIADAKRIEAEPDPGVIEQATEEKRVTTIEDKPQPVQNKRNSSQGSKSKEPNGRNSITSLYIDNTKSVESEPPVEPVIIDNEEREFEDLKELSDINSVLDFSFDVKSKNGRRLSDLVKEERTNLEPKGLMNNNDSDPISEVGKAIFDSEEFSKRRSLTKDTGSKRGRRLSEKLKSIVEENSDFDAIVAEREKIQKEEQDALKPNKPSRIAKVAESLDGELTDIQPIVEEKVDPNSQDNMFISSSPLTKTFCETSMFNDEVIYSSSGKTNANADIVAEKAPEQPVEKAQDQNKLLAEAQEIQEKLVPPPEPIENEKPAKKVNNRTSNLGRLQQAILGDQEDETDFFNNRKTENNKKIIEEPEIVKTPTKSPMRSVDPELAKPHLHDSIKKSEGIDPQLREMILLSSSKKPAKKTQQFASLVKAREYQELLNKTAVQTEKPNAKSKNDQLGAMRARIEKLHADIMHTLESRKEDVEFLQKVTEGFGYDKKTRENELKRLVQLKINHSLLLSSKVALNKDIQSVLADHAGKISTEVSHKPKRTITRNIIERLFGLALIRAERTSKGVEYTLRYKSNFIIFAKCKGNTKKLEFLQMYFLESQKTDNEAKSKLSEIFVKLYEKRLAQTKCKELFDALGYICKLHDAFMEVMTESERLVASKQVESYTMDKECTFSYIVKPHRLPLMTLAFKLVATDNCNWHLSYSILEENKKLNMIFDRSYKDAFAELNNYVEGIFSKERVSIGSKLSSIIKKVNGFSLASFKYSRKRGVSVDQSNSKLSGKKSSE